MPVLTLSSLDLAVVCGFVALMLAMGFSARLRDASAFQFITAGRNLTLGPFVASLVSSWYGGILGIGESVSYYGLGTWALLGLPYYVFAIVYAWRYAKRARELPQISLPETLAARFGPKMGLVGGGLIYLLAVPAAHALMLGVLVQAVTGWNLAVSMIVAMVAGSALLFKGGLLADVRLSIPAFVMMYVGFGAMAIWAITNHPPATAFSDLRATQLWSWDGGQGLLPFLTFFILGAWTLVDPGFHQRVASAATPEISQRGVLLSAACWMIFDALSITAGLYALALGVQTAGGAGPGNPLLIFPALAEQTLPPGLKAVFLCGMIGTISSAMIGYALVSGSTFGREIVGRVWPHLSDPHIKRWSSIGIVISAVVAIAVGHSLSSVVSLWYAWSGAVVGSLLIPVSVAFGVLRVRASNTVVWIVTIIAAVCALGWMIHGQRTGNPFLNVQIGESVIGIGTLLPGFAISAIGIGFASAFANSRDAEPGKSADTIE